LEWHYSNIQRSDEFNGRSDPYVKVYFRNGENGKDTKFYTTSTIDNVENARWDDVVEFPNYRPKTEQVSQSFRILGSILTRINFYFKYFSTYDSNSVTLIQ